MECDTFFFFRLRSRFDQTENRIALQASGRVSQELVPLSTIAAHVEEPGARARLHRRYQISHTLVQVSRIGTTGDSQFLDDL
jgi:hypothetical protein